MSETIEPQTLPETADATELPETETPEAEAPPDDAPEEEEGEVVVTFGDEAPPADPEPTPDSNPLKLQRERIKALEREKRELEDRLRAKESPIPEAPLGPEPNLEDYDYDESKFKAGWRDWTERKRQADEKAAKANAEARAKEEAWQAKLADYGQAKAKLKVPDYEEAEERIQQIFDVVQQSAMVHCSDTPALTVYALGKHPAKARELAAFKKDPMKFAYALGKLETQMKTTSRPRAAPPPPETLIQSTAPSRSAVNATLERLDQEALRTGDRSKVVAYMRQIRAQGKK
jgi:DNA repair exonuclease SbcCD ATPase subunit